METEANKMIKQPSYRFAGYTEPWEERKFSHYLTESRVKGNSGDIAKKLTVKLWSKGIVPKLEQYSGSSATQYYIRSKGQFMYGKLDFLNQAFGIIPEELDGYESTLDSPAFDISKSLNSSFLLEYVARKEFYEYQGIIANGSRKAKRIHVDTFLDMPINVPSLPEQTSIGSFFQDIDQLISIQQRKLGVLKEQKKTYLKLLFPAKGQTKPDLRFAGFEDEWKEVKLGDLILKGGSGGTPKSTVAKYYGGDIPFLSITDISNSGKYLKKTEKTITNEGLQNSSAWVVPEGAISLAMYASVGKLAILGIDCATSQAFYNMVFEDDIVRNFVYTTLEKANIYNEWGSLISTGTQANLNAEKVKNFSFLHPSKPEQEAIGSFFQDLDKAITKQEEKVNQLKESKQTLLRKMFI
jgi:hypothetical protein